MSSSGSSSSATTGDQAKNDVLDSTGYCLLSLDGGGVRGLATLYILQRTMKELNFRRRDKGLGPKKPCEIFDLMGGTSTGGSALPTFINWKCKWLSFHRLIAIMLGRLQMSVEDCIIAYVKLMRRIFERKENRSIMSTIGRVKPRFSAQALSEAIVEVLRASGHSPSESFEEPGDPTCKV